MIHPPYTQSNAVCFSKSLAARMDDAPSRWPFFKPLLLPPPSPPPGCPVAFYFVRASILNTLNEDIPAEISYGYPTGGGELSRQNPPRANENGVAPSAAEVSSRTGWIYSHVERTD